MAKQAHGSRATNIGPPERIFSVASGAWLALSGLRRRSLTGKVLAAAGATLLYRGATGHSALYQRLRIDTLTDSPTLHFKQAVTVNRPPQEVYGYWRNVENLARFMRHVRSVEALSPTRSRWVAQTPVGRKTLAWESEIIADVPNERIAWHSVEGSAIATSGSVAFRPAPGNRGTEVHVVMDYRPPTGTVTLSKLMVPLTESMLHEDIRRFKRMLELGELPTTQGQPAARRLHAVGGAA